VGYAVEYVALAVVALSAHDVTRHESVLIRESKMFWLASAALVAVPVTAPVASCRQRSVSLTH